MRGGPFRPAPILREIELHRLDPAGAAMLPTARKLAFSDVPVVDLGQAWSGDAGERRALADKIAEVCGRVGFMYIKNHRIADADVAAIFKTAADFHNLPLETKMELSMARNADAQGQGYLHGMTKGNAKTLSENLQEAFQFRRPLAEDDPGSPPASRCMAASRGRKRCPTSRRG